MRCRTSDHPFMKCMIELITGLRRRIVPYGRVYSMFDKANENVLFPREFPLIGFWTPLRHKSEKNSLILDAF